MRQSNKIEAAPLICLGLRTHRSDNPPLEEYSAMLVWEEENSTEHVPAASTAPRVAPAVAATPLNTEATLPVPRPVEPAAESSTRRVRAADKRIINGATDVNQLVPFKYKWAREKYLAA